MTIYIYEYTYILIRVYTYDCIYHLIYKHLHLDMPKCRGSKKGYMETA